MFGEGGESRNLLSLSAYNLDPSPSLATTFAVLAQFIAFRRSDRRLIAVAAEPLAAISRAAPPEDYLWAGAGRYVRASP